MTQLLGQVLQTETEVLELEQKFMLYMTMYSRMTGQQQEMDSKAGLRIPRFHGMFAVPKADLEPWINMELLRRLAGVR